MAVNNNMIYTRICVDCGKVMRNVGRRAERCPECRAVHIRVKALEASYRERTEQLIRQQEERAEAIHQGLVDDNERFTASAGTYGKGRIKEIIKTRGFSEKPTETDSPLKLKTNNYSDTKVSESSSAEALPPTPKSRFSPPDVETVKKYFAEKGGTEAQAIRFHAYYESNGWKVGRNPMKNWKAAASGWISRDRDEAKKANAPRNRAFMASRPAEEAENAKNFLADAARRRPLKKQ